MNCTECNGGTKVIDSRATGEGVRRRRECLACGTRFTTLETLVGHRPAAAAAPRPAPKPKPKPKPVPKPVPNKRQRAATRRRIEDMREARALDDDDYDDFSPMTLLRGY